MREELIHYGLSEGALGLCLLLESNTDIESLVRRFLTELFDFLGKQPTNSVEVRIAQLNPEETRHHLVGEERTTPEGIVIDTIKEWEVHFYKAAMILPIKFEDLRSWATYQAAQLRNKETE